jgi:squalene cyclase
LDHPALRRAVRPQIDELERAIRPTGIGMSDIFLPDGDDTAAALAVLRASGRPINFGIMDTFARDQHFCAYPGELQSSISVTAHAAHTLALLGRDHQSALAYMVERQLPDGRWNGDKWNGSWLYTTSQVVLALRGTGHRQALNLATEAILSRQYPDGSWGTRGSTIEETAYAIVTLRALAAEDMANNALYDALAAAERWMLRQYQPFATSSFTCWLGKEMYRPLRLARMIELVATLPAAQPLPHE